ncbi:MAG: MFS transporter [Chloroflexi bacterium]|nr:MAG: MFS transporter [Chloroflexota bacterium]MBL1195257.1 MFS transporter [Chloroflexota bacterium]NOH12543.1 MFS transporter [Chloroflexota bacterium]
MTPQAKPMLLPPILRLFLFSMVLANIAGGMIWFLLPLYLADLGASVTQIGLTFTITGFVLLALQIFGGYLSDTIGRLQTIAIGSVGGLLGDILLLLAPGWGWAVVAIAISEVSAAAVVPSFPSFIAEQSTEEQRGRVFGISESIYMVVNVIAPLLAGFLASSLGFKAMIGIATFIYAIAVVLRIWMARNAQQTVDGNGGKPSFSGLRQQLFTTFGLITAGGLLLWLLVTDGVRDISMRLSSELVPLYLEQVGGLSIQNIGVLGALFGLGWMLSTIPSGWAADRFGERRSIAAGFFVQFVSFMLLVNADSLWSFGFAWFLFGAGVGTMNPAFQSLVSKAVPANMRGMAYGFFQTSLGFLSLPAPFIGAQLWERFNPQLPFILTGLLALVGMVLAWLTLRTRPSASKE